MAGPGRIDSPKSSGAHWLIQQGATLVQKVDDVFDVLGWSAATMPANAGTDTVAPGLSPAMQQVLSALDAYPADIDSLAQKTGMAVSTLQPLLLNLELQGLVRQLPGQLYEKIIP